MQSFYDLQSSFAKSSCSMNHLCAKLSSLNTSNIAADMVTSIVMDVSKLAESNASLAASNASLGTVVSGLAASNASLGTVVSGLAASNASFMASNVDLYLRMDALSDSNAVLSTNIADITQSNIVMSSNIGSTAASNANFYAFVQGLNNTINNSTDFDSFKIGFETLMNSYAWFGSHQ
jgi:hypothetical protein